MYKFKIKGVYKDYYRKDPKTNKPIEHPETIVVHVKGKTFLEALGKLKDGKARHTRTNLSLMEVSNPVKVDGYEILDAWVGDLNAGHTKFPECVGWKMKSTNKPIKGAENIEFEFSNNY